jgi:hypothetical protein
VIDKHVIAYLCEHIILYCTVIYVVIKKEIAGVRGRGRRGRQGIERKRAERGGKREGNYLFHAF